MTSQTLPTVKVERAALLVAEDTLTDQQIADKVGIGKRSLERLKNLPEFQAQVQHHLDLWRKKLEAEGIANKRNRIAALNRRWKLMGDIALLGFDAAMYRELREHEKQAAQELGEWTEKVEHKGEVLIRGYGSVPIAEV